VRASYRTVPLPCCGTSKLGDSLRREHDPDTIPYSYSYSYSRRRLVCPWAPKPATYVVGEETPPIRKGCKFCCHLNIFEMPLLWIRIVWMCFANKPRTLLYLSMRSAFACVKHRTISRDRDYSICACCHYQREVRTETTRSPALFVRGGTSAAAKRIPSITMTHFKRFNLVQVIIQEDRGSHVVPRKEYGANANCNIIKSLDWAYRRTAKGPVTLIKGVSMFVSQAGQLLN